MATGTGNLPHTQTYVSPFDVITSQAENETQDNIASLADGTGRGDGSVTTDQIADAAVTASKVDLTTLLSSFIYYTQGAISVTTAGVDIDITFPNEYQDIPDIMVCAQGSGVYSKNTLWTFFNANTTGCTVRGTSVSGSGTAGYALLIIGTKA